jgi:hypothetical protein
MTESLKPCGTVKTQGMLSGIAYDTMSAQNEDRFHVVMLM